jgi:hypothetical protein
LCKFDVAQPLLVVSVSYLSAAAVVRVVNEQMHHLRRGLTLLV